MTADHDHTRRPQAVFLRGVNVNGITVKSALLKSTLLAIDGIETARTVLASGNVLVTGTSEGEELKGAVEAALREAFDYDAQVVVIDREHVAALVAANPYETDSDTMHAYITMSNDPAALDSVEAKAKQAGLAAEEYARLSPVALAWQTPVGTSTTAAMAKLLGVPPLKDSTTTRNVRTLTRLLDLTI